MNTALNIYIGGFLNPRTTETTDIFYFYSLDGNGYSIDESSATDYFTITMNTMSSIVAISVDSASHVNGELNTYTITVIPNTPLINGD
jgi:hypothetical protein